MDPVIVATWKFGAEACEVGCRALAAGKSALDAVELGANAVEDNPNVNSVGYGGLPNRAGEVELDAAIMDGRTHSAGAVGAIVDYRNPISVARRVMEQTPHVMLVGNNAGRFAWDQGFPKRLCGTPESRAAWEAWMQTQSEADVAHFADQVRAQEAASHDTVGVCALDSKGDLAVGCTTSGMAWKVPGRVGDSPILGSGLYVENGICAASATGNGDEIMKACVSFRVVQLVGAGRSPQDACEESLRALIRLRPRHQGRGAACIAVGADGRVGGAATKEGFSAPDRLWFYAVGTSAGVALHEGPYVE